MDEDHKKVRSQLNSGFHDKNPVALHEYLPILFAMDFLRNFSRNTYKRVCEFTYIQNKHAENLRKHFDNMLKNIIDGLIGSAKFSTAHELAKSSYEKFLSLFGDEPPKTVNAIKNLAEILHDDQLLERIAYVNA